MKLFPVFAALLIALTVVPASASAASTSCGTPTQSLMEDPDGLNLPLDKVPTPAPLYTKCVLQFTAYGGFSFIISGDLTGEMQIQFTDAAGNTQTYWYDVVLGQPTLERAITYPLSDGATRMSVKVQFTEPSPLGSAGAVGDWRVSVDYT